MDPQRWQRMWSVFHRALELPPEDRGAFIEGECGGEPELLGEVERLLADLDRAPSVLDPLSGDEGLTEDPLVGSRIGAYRLDRIIGHGGMGTVYAASQEEPIQRPVALKLIRLGMDTAEVVARFEAERQALALMDHRHIATVHDAGATAEGRPFFVMELVNGLPLNEHCDRACLSVRERLELFLPVCHAVQHAHQKGVIHRDLKPSNILVAHQNGASIAKVIDFGIAKAIHRRLSDHTLATVQGQAIGTPAYMSPEQAAGAADIDTRSDVYSLGVVLYELLAGSLPTAEGGSRAAGAGAAGQTLRDADPVTPSVRVSTPGVKAAAAAQRRGTDQRTLRRQLRGDLDWIVMRALAPARDRRYATAAELAEDLSRHLANQPVLAGPPTVAYRLRKFARRHRIGVAVSLAALATLLIGSAGTTWMAIVAGRERRAAVAARDQAQEQAETARAVIRVLEDLLGAPDPMGDFAGAGAARDVRVRDVLDRATELLPDLGERPTVEAALRRTLGTTYLNLGDAAAATEHFRRARELDLLASGPDDPATLASNHHLARALRVQGRLEEAEATLRPVLGARSRVLGPEHRDTLASMLNLANVVFERGHDAEAEQMLNRLIPIQRRTLGDRHPDTLTALNSLVLVLSRQGRQREAEPVAREVLASSTLVHGPHHPSTLLNLGSLATVLEESGELAEAEKTFRDLMARYQRVLGDDHPTTLQSIQNLAAVLSRLERRDEAERLYRQVLASYRTSMPADHPVVLVTAHNLARTLTEAGEADEAVAMYGDILERARRTLGPDHYLVATFEGGLGAGLLRLGRYAEAERALNASYQRLDEVFGYDHRRTQTARRRLLELYEAWGRPAAAEPYR